VSDATLDRADPMDLARQPRDVALCYVGNQYDRDEAFGSLVAPAAHRLSHVVAGKWTDTRRWAHVNFVGRVPFPEVEAIHRRSVATVTLLPHRYERAGQMTQRLFEAVLAGCLPLIPTSVRSHAFGPTELAVANGDEVLATTTRLIALRGSAEHVRLLRACLDALDRFRLSRQIDVLDALLAAPSQPATAWTEDAPL
jgi:hypothetical protein